ncbi:hypothetical protein, partial [Streptomyces hirsutus]|uniref:hypothetical protein n=1 Tax=Streptomyces hirsutus TaxID=35620 RepID=UPI003F4D2652
MRGRRDGHRHRRRAPLNPRRDPHPSAPSAPSDFYGDLVMTESTTIRWEQDDTGVVTLVLDDPNQSANTMN